MSFKLKLGLLLTCGLAFAEIPPENEELTLPFLRENRVDLVFNYQQLNPEKTFGNIKSGYLTYSQKVNNLTTYLYNLTYITRREGRGVIAQFGAYRDWNESFYTFTAITTATRADFLPRYRFDQEFYVKVGSEKRFVIPLTAYFTSFFNRQQSFNLGTGLLCYLPGWILEYRLFLVQNFPGHKVSFSQTASIGYGEEGWRWIFLSGGYGRNAYIANYDVDPQDINQRVIYANFNGRNWLSTHWGVIYDFRYTDIKDAYQVYSGSLGLFMEF